MGGGRGGGTKVINHKFIAIAMKEITLCETLKLKSKCNQHF